MSIERTELANTEYKTKIKTSGWLKRAWEFLLEPEPECSCKLCAKAHRAD